LEGYIVTIDNLIPSLRELSRSDKLRAIQFLAAELEKETNAVALEPGAEYAVWSPFDAYEAAHTLQQLLDERYQ
jgi:hypothetical protein